MVVLEWKDSFDVGIDKINNEHKHLIKLLNDLSASMSQGKSKEVMGKILKELVSYGVSHFDTEENLFKKYNYPSSAEHIYEHEKFKKEVSKLVAEYESGSLLLSVETLKFLREWITNHILKTDLKYKEYLKTHMTS